MFNQRSIKIYNCCGWPINRGHHPYCGGHVDEEEYDEGIPTHYPEYYKGACTRERCGMCHKISPIGFHVPDKIWKACVHPHYQNEVLCLSCFVSMADEKMIDWDNYIKFYPVSLKTHLER